MTYVDRELNSLHEAGHAVALIVLGGKVDRVDMFSTYQTRDSKLEPWAGVVMCVAGAVATRTLGRQRRSLARAYSPQDLGVAASHLDKLGIVTSSLTGNSTYITRAEKDARELVLNNARAVRRVAEALRHAGELSGADVERLVNGESVNDVLAAPTKNCSSTRQQAAGSTAGEAIAGARTVTYEVWQDHKTAEWYATSTMYNDPVLWPCEGVGDTEAEAVENLRRHVARCTVHSKQPFTLLLTRRESLEAGAGR